MLPARCTIARTYQTTAIARACQDADAKCRRLTVEATLDGTIVDGIPDWDRFRKAFPNRSIAKMEQVRQVAAQRLMNGHYTLFQTNTIMTFAERHSFLSVPLTH
jgi:hypothetical protein